MAGPKERVRVIACPRPFSAERLEIELPAGATLEEILAAAQPDPVLLRHAHVFLDDWPVPPENWRHVRPKAGHTITLRVVPQGGGGGGKNPLRTVLSLAVLAASFAAPGLLPAGLAGQGVFGGLTVGGLVSAATALAGAPMVNALRPPRRG
jgi:hypothetical protein